MKKVICILLAVSLILSLASPVFAAESEEAQYGTINVEYSDALGSIERLNVMVKDNHVYADAFALSDRLGYDCIQDGNLVSIYANNVFFYQNAPLLAVHFRINESKVSYNPLFGAEFEYTTPAPCIVDDKGVWVPLTYTLVLLGGNSTMLEDTLLVQMPRNNVLSIAAAIVNNEDNLSFDWVTHFGYSETTTNVTDGAARIVTLFSGLLEFDGAAWLSLIDWDAFDRKFGKSLVTMLCSRSWDELEEDTWQVEAMLELLSDDGKLGEMLRNKQVRINSDVTAWQTACENYLKLMEDGSSSPAKYNMLYRQCERAMDQQMQFAALGGEGMIQIQDALSSATNALDIASIIGEAVSYMTEFQQTDEYLFSVLENYLNQRTATDHLPDATAQSMDHYLRVMDLGALGYSAYSYIEENWLKCIVDESGLDVLLGAPANALLFTWDIMSETIPFYSGGLDAVEDREISNYAQKVQNDALENLKYLIAELKKSASISTEDCVQLSEYCYVYLKACYIARSSAINSLDNTSEEFQRQIKGKLDVEADINEIIIQYLPLLSSADIENSCYILGFLPKNNAEYLNDYSDDKLLASVSGDSPSSSNVAITPGIYAQENHELNRLTIHEVDSQTFEFTASELDLFNITAVQDGDKASFEFLTPNGKMRVAGTLESPATQTVTLTILESSHDFIGTGEYHYTLIGRIFTDAELKAISKELNVPENLDVQISQGEPSYWDGGGFYRTPIEIYYNGELIAGASVHSLTGGLAGAIYVYSGHTDTTSMYAGGSCGAKLSWSLSSDGTLTISGSGDMDNYAVGDDGPPWLEEDVEITQIVFDGNITSIGENAFCQTSIENITIPASVSAIQYGALDFIDTLEGIWVETGNTVYSNDDSGVLFDKDKTVLISAPTRLTGKYTVPISVTWIYDNAFLGCAGIKTISWPDRISRIGQGAFSGCSGLEYICIPSNVTVIEPYTFYACSKMTGIRIPEGITSIGWAAFGECPLTDVYYGGTNQQWQQLMEKCSDDTISGANVYELSY